MPRVHLFEIEDQTWCPGILRDLATDYLNFVQTRFALHRAMISLLRDALQRAGTTQVLDLCSGAGGPVLALYEALLSERIPVSLTLTDLYPNLSAFRRLSAQHPEGISSIEHPVGAAKIPRNLPGLRTIFNGFHHFAPGPARAVLECAVEARQPIAIFEIPERRWSTMLPLLLTPLLVAMATPFIRPFLWRRLLWTYLDSRSPILELLGRLGLTMPGVHRGGTVGPNAGSRCLRVECWASQSGQHYWSTHLPCGNTKG